MKQTWRQTVRPIIARVIREEGTDDPQALQRALTNAYPARPFERWPYRVWRDEIRIQLGEETP